MELNDETYELYEKIKKFKLQIDKKFVVNKRELKDIQCLYHLMKATMKTFEKAEEIYFNIEKL